MFLHESQYLEPVMPDIEAMLTSSQRHVNGTAILKLRPYSFQTVGVINQSTKAGWFPELFGQAYGLNVLLVLLLTVGMFLYLKYSKQGYEITVVGDSVNTARYAGISVKKVTIRTMAISGAICGLAAAGLRRTLAPPKATSTS